MPLFSSFNPKGIFKPPPSSKDYQDQNETTANQKPMTAQSQRPNTTIMNKSHANNNKNLVDEGIDP